MGKSKSRLKSKTRSSKGKTLLAVGGLDPSAHAGLLADAKVFVHYRIPFAAAVTAVTAQSEKKFFAWRPVLPELFHQQLQATQEDREVFGVKIGMLATLSHAQVLVDWLTKTKPAWVLWDPVWRSSTGTPLLRAEKFHPVLQKLLRLCHVFTPNLIEAQWILKRSICNLDEMEVAAQELRARAAKQAFVVLKGGHFSSSKQAIDLYCDSKQSLALSASRLPRDPRGTGCSFGAALLSGLWQKQNSLQATRMAKRYVLDFLF